MSGRPLRLHDAARHRDAGRVAADATSAVPQDGVPPAVGGPAPARTSGLRMSSERLSAQLVLEALDSDPRLADLASRCAVLAHPGERSAEADELYADRCPPALAPAAGE
jgi:hypothetical protein